MASSFVCTSPLAVITVVGLLDVVKVSNAAEVKSFLLIMCIDAPGSTTKSLSSGLIVDGAGRLQFTEGEKNAVLCFSFNFRICLASLHAASRAHRSCHSVSPETDPQILEHWGYAAEDHLGNRTHRIVFSMFELFREIDEDFGGSIS